MACLTARFLKPHARRPLMALSAMPQTKAAARIPHVSRSQRSVSVSKMLAYQAQFMWIEHKLFVLEQRAGP
jgi:hypothetical protein